MGRNDRLIGIFLGIFVGIVALILFVFLGSSGSIDGASLNNDSPPAQHSGQASP
jgi:hypothetical protein